MSADHFRNDLASIGLNQSEFARWIGVDSRTVRSWAAGKWPVPLAIGYLLSLMVRTSTDPDQI